MSSCSWPHGLQHTRFLAFHHLPEFAQTHVHWVGDAIQPSHLCHSLLYLPSIFPNIRVFLKSQHFTSGDQSIGVSTSASVFPMNIQGWFPLRLNWFDLLAVQATLKSLLQYHSLEASNLWPSAFFMVQLSHPYTTTGKTIPLTIWTFVGKVMSLLFNTVY